MEFAINLTNAASVVSQLESGKSKLNQYQSSVQAAISKCPLSGSTKTAVCNSLRKVSAAISNESRSLQSMSNNLEQIISIYSAAEKKLAGVEIETGAAGISDGSGAGMAGEAAASAEEDGNLSELKGSLLGGSVTAAGSLMGIGLSGTAEGNLIGGSVKTESKMKYKPEEGEVTAEKSVAAEGYVAQGKLSGSFGLAGASVTGTIGAVSAKGSVGATLFKDGKFSPALTAKAKAEAAAVKGEAEGTIGSETNNAHVKASGKLLGATAEASAAAGKITYENSSGKTVSAYGVQGKVGAEAYVAEGKVSGGFTLFGIEIDLGISGKAGGAGVSASGQVTTGGTSGSIGAGLGLGLGLEISIDWSNFSLW